MKINGKELDGPQVQTLVIPRGDEEIVIKAKAVLDYEAFNKLNPVPTPPKKVFPGGEEQIDIENPAYMDKLEEWAQSKTDWMILKSLEATEGLTWDTVDRADPKTWKNYKDEMAKCFTPAEAARIINLVTIACGLDEEKIQEATKRFLATQAAPQDE